MSNPYFLVLLALLSVVAFAALVISLVSLVVARANSAALTSHESECRKTDGEIYDKLRVCVASQTKVNEDILITLSNIEGAFNALFPDLVEAAAARRQRQRQPSANALPPPVPGDPP